MVFLKKQDILSFSPFLLKRFIMKTIFRFHRIASFYENYSSKKGNYYDYIFNETKSRFRF